MAGACFRGQHGVLYSDHASHTVIPRLPELIIEKITYFDVIVDISRIIGRRVVPVEIKTLK